jgi:trimeric autotransporter adhesin
VGFSVQPSDAISDVGISPDIKTQIQDAGGNLVTSATNGVSLVITSPDTPGGTLAGNTSQVSTAGVATFHGISIDKAGSYTLTAQSTGLTSAVSNGFGISHGVANKLKFTQNPSSSTGGTAFGTQPIVTVQDFEGNTVTNDTSQVTLTITAGTPASGGPGTLSCTTDPLGATAGIAQFGGCKVDRVGTGYTLHATDGSLASADSATFNVTVGSAAQLAFTTQPSASSQSSTAFAQQPVVTVEDAGGNTVTGDSSSVTLSITSGTPASGGPGALSCTTNPVAASSGVATFAGCKVDIVGTGYRLHAADGSLAIADSSAFNITPGTASKLVFTTSPSSSTGGVAFGTQPVVTVEDAAGNVVTGDSSNVTLSITGSTPTSGGPGVVSCTTNPVAASSGVATFAGCAINTAGIGYKLHAADGGLTAADSSAFTITVGPAKQLAFTLEPSNGFGGSALGTQPKVSIEDAGGNVVTTDGSSVTISIKAATPASGGPGTLFCTTNPLAASSGVAAFAGCKIDKIGTGYELHAIDGSLTAADSTPFDITLGPAAQLVFTTQPSASSASQTAFAQQPAVTEEDAGGNTETTDSTHTVTLSLDAPTTGGPGTLGCTSSTLTLIGGVANFAGCNVDKVGTGYRLHATTSAGAFTADSSTFAITPGTATKLSFTTQPGGGTGGTAWAQQPAVTVQDAAGNTVTTDSSAVTLTITTLTPPSGGPGTLSCTTDPLGATAGVAGFSGCKINTAGTGYKLHAADGGLTAVDSSAFDITVGSAAQLVFSQQPTSSTGGTAFGTQPIVTVEDAGGNTVTTNSSSVTLAITSGTPTSGGPGTLSCTTNPVAASSGVATFAGCRINTVGTGYKLHASDGSLTAADSTPIDITVGGAAQVAFTQEPSSSTGGTAFATQPAVSVEDAGGNLVSTDVSSITLSLVAPGSGGPGALTCNTNPLAASAGVATFAGCRINTVGTGYKLHAVDGALTPADSTALDITVGPAAQLAFTTQPSATSNGGAAFSSQPVVTVEDAGGNTVTGNTSSVTLALTNGTAGANLSCTSNPLAASSGVATFTNCKVDKAGSGYQLHATDGTLSPADSSAFTIQVGPASQLVFTTEPSGSTGGVALPTQPTVTVEDAGGNTVTTDASTVTLSITAATPTSGSPGTLSCTGGNSLVASSGVATFGGCKIDTAGTGYKLHAADSGAAAATDSTAFDITAGPATHLAFTQQPTSSTGGTTFGTQPTVAVEDAGGNTVSTDASSVTLSIKAGTPASGGPGVLTCTTDPLTASSGVAAFGGCKINTAGTGYRLHAVDGALTPADSNAINITVGPAAQLAFTTQPSATSNGGAVFASQPVVTVEDAGGNTVSGDTSNVTLTLGAPTTGGPGALTCTTNPVAASAGVATFAGCKVNTAGTGYKLHAADGLLAAPDSTPFDITVGPAAQLGFTQSPGASTGGTAFTAQPHVAVQDAGGNTVTTDTSAVTLSIKAGTPTSGGPGSVTCTTNPVNAVSGVATFSGCTINTAGSGYRLHADDGTLTAADSTAFDVSAGTATKLVFTQQPSSSTGGTAFGTQPKVSVEDAGGNVVSADTSTVTLSITGGTPATGGPGALSCTTDPLAATSGVAAFAGCSIDTAGTGYALHAADGSLTAADSTTFDVTVGPAAKLVFTQQPSNSTGGTAFGTQPKVSVEDAGGNVVATDTSPVSLVIKPGTPTSGGPGNLSCTTNPVNAAAGVATFAGCAIDTAGTGYKLHATDGVLTAADSAAFDVTVGSPAKLVFSQQPTNTKTGATITPAPAVTIEDAGNNVVTTAVNQVSMAIGTNAGVPSGTLGGTTPQSPASGVATFPDLSINNPGTNYTLTASINAGAITVASSAFEEIGLPNHLAFQTQPTTTTAGQTMAAFTVAVEDAAGNVVPDATNNVAITSNPLTTVGGTKTQVTTGHNGIATFNDIVIDKSGSYTFSANSTALSPDAVSSSFTINVGPVASVVCTDCPAKVGSVEPFTPTANGTNIFTLHLADQFGNLVATNASTTYNITATLTCGATCDSGRLSSGLSTSAIDTTLAPATVTVTIASGSVSQTVTYNAPAVLPSGGRGDITFSDGASTTLTPPADDIQVQDP